MAGGAKGRHCSSSRAAEQAADNEDNEQWLIESKERGRRRTRSDWNASTRKYAALQQRWDAQMREAAREEEFECMTMMQPGDAAALSIHHLFVHHVQAYRHPLATIASRRLLCLAR